MVIGNLKFISIPIGTSRWIRTQYLISINLPSIVGGSGGIAMPLAFHSKLSPPLIFLPFGKTRKFIINNDWLDYKNVILLRNINITFLQTYIFLRSVKIQLFNDPKIIITKLFNKNFPFFIFVFFMFSPKFWTKIYTQIIVILLDIFLLISNL